MDLNLIYVDVTYLQVYTTYGKIRVACSFNEDLHSDIPNKLPGSLGPHPLLRCIMNIV